MSDELTTTPETTPEDPTKNLKAEMDRKLGNLNDQLSQVLEKINQQPQQVSAASIADYNPAAPASKQQENLSDLIYSDPDRYTQIVQERAERAALTRIEAQQQAQAKQNEVLNKIVQEFPEVNTPGTKMYDKIQDVVKNMSPEERGDSNRWESLVYRAAMEVGVKPRSLRKAEDGDDFVLSGGSSAQRRSAAPKEPEMDPATEAFADIMFNYHPGKGKMSKEEYLQRVKEKSQRKNWNKRS